MKKKYIILISILILLIVIRIILPYVVLHFANKKLANLDNYYGHIEDIDISLYRGAYIIKNIYLNKDDPVTKKQTRFFTSKDIDLSLEWGALLHGSIVGKLVFDSAELFFTKDRTELSQVRKDTSDFRNVLESLMPLKVNRFEVEKGRFSLYTEMAAKEGKFKGYVKPIIKGLQVIGPKDSSDTFSHKLWEY